MYVFNILPCLYYTTPCTYLASCICIHTRYATPVEVQTSGSALVLPRERTSPDTLKYKGIQLKRNRNIIDGNMPLP
ncbi:hypothetical protein VTN00DRAFT_1313 [Thermoascus crustaceus]|uniref:uncharacterized protein n=1 Tax=Thermoascus crustaceus TaxID=5088 RepID=UPI0037431A6B